MAPRIALGLSGGGAAGLGHIPVFEALDAAGQRPIAIAGASIGAILGAAYAAGMSGADIRAHVLKLHANPTRLASRAANHFWDRLGVDGLPRVDDPSLALDLILPPDFPENFEDLTIPLTVVATDFHRRCPAVFRSGPLRPALAASMAIPAVFRPMVIDGRVCIDGGVANNLPLDQLPEAEITIAVDVASTPPVESSEPPGALAVTLGAMRIMMREMMVRMLRTHPPTILIEPPSRLYGPLDFALVPEILAAADPVRDEMSAALARALAKG